MLMGDSPLLGTAICTGISQIQTGVSDVVIAGGVETFSDVRPTRIHLILLHIIQFHLHPQRSLLQYVQYKARTAICSRLHTFCNLALARPFEEKVTLIGFAGADSLFQASP